SDDPYLGEKIAKGAKSFASRVLQSHIQARDEDLASYLATEDRDLQELSVAARSGPVGINGQAMGELARRVQTKAQAMGEPAGYRVLPKALSEHVGSVLSELPVSEHANVITQMREEMGENGPAVFRQLLADKAIPEGSRVLLNAEGARSYYAKNVIGNAVN